MEAYRPVRPTNLQGSYLTFTDKGHHASTSCFSAIYGPSKKGEKENPSTLEDFSAYLGS